ncbi:MAG: ABC transporter permease [Firmicutes bacterium]|nr:ABC transporter permease [Bacillota bacterium]
MNANKSARKKRKYKDKALYYLKKLSLFVISVFVLSIIVFWLSRLTPGDPLMAYYGERASQMGEAERAHALTRLGLDQPTLTQYIYWLKNAFEGDFGISFKYKQPVLSVIAGRLLNTVLLGGIGFVLMFIFALLLGVFCIWYEDRLADKILCKVGTIISCIPEFWLSLVLILIFSVILHIAPSSGAYSIGHSGDVADRIRHLILPLIAVILSHLWYYTYMIRNKLAEEVREDYVLLAKAKGLTRREIMFKHCIRGILPAYFSIMAISIPHVVGGTYIVEMLFSYPGIGTLSYEAAQLHDYNMLMVLCIITGVVVIFFNILSQIINERIDPRIKAQEKTEEMYESLGENGGVING